MLLLHVFAFGVMGGMWLELPFLLPLAQLDLEIRPRDDRMSFAARLALGFCLWQCLWHFQLSMSYTVPPALLELLARRSRSPVLYFAGSFNPAHAGHLEAINEAKRQVAKKHREAGNRHIPISIFSEVNGLINALK